VPAQSTTLLAAGAGGRFAPTTRHGKGLVTLPSGVGVERAAVGGTFVPALSRRDVAPEQARRMLQVELARLREL
jgi:hypothetical protein